MAFNSADTAAFKNVWVFCEQRQGKMMPTTFELISEGRKLADELGVELCGILLGDNVDGIAKELGGYGADKVYVYNSPLLKDYTTDAYTKVITDAVEEIKPEILLFGASNIGRDLAPRCAARLHTGLCADCTHLDIDYACKSTDRSALNRLFARRGVYDDILIVRRHLLTDTSIANIALFDGSHWHTPQHPLLKGTKRAELLDKGILTEKDIRTEELPAYSTVRLFNAMIDWGEVELPADCLHPVF